MPPAGPSRWRSVSGSPRPGPALGGQTQSEALALRWADVDIEHGTLTVRRGVHRISGRGLVYEEPKADRSRRTLALPDPLVEALRAHRGAQLEERITAGPLWEVHDLVFAQPNGRPIERKSDWRAWKAPPARGGRARGPPARRSAHGGDAAAGRGACTCGVVMEVLGHAQMRTTTDTYS